MRNANIVEFPSGRLLARRFAGRMTVAALVKRLASRGSLPSPATMRRPLSVKLADLTGISDTTLDLLTALADRRLLSPASAARLAMRHAHEVGQPKIAVPSGRKQLPFSHHLVLVGDLFSRSAFRIEERSTGAWVACATFAALDLLSDVCPMDGMPFCILPNLNGKPPTSMVLRRPRDWRIDLAKRAAIADRAAERHVLIVGGLPSSGRDRAVIVAGVEDGLRRCGLRVLPERRSPPGTFGSADERDERARRHLVLIEIAFPGLVVASGGGR